MSIAELDGHFRNYQEVVDRMTGLLEDNNRLSELQNHELSGVDRFSPTPDSIIVNMFGNLRRLVRLYSKALAKEFRAALKDRLQAELEGMILTPVVEDSVWAEPDNVVPFAESFIWKKLCEDVFWSPFQVFGVGLEKVWKDLFDDGAQPSVLSPWFSR
jgi:hypothetical protein